MKNFGKPHGLSGCYAQENPELDGQAEEGPQGMEDPPELTLKLLDDMAFFTSGLWHSGQFTVSLSLDEVLSTSKCFAHFLHIYS
ncbi:MAG: hypothetical protein WGN25_08330 [Candidatus Electrothrix sp. GW3-4]|uniref:hypothetical protein n=1 Tax=Candidatus Electrothrix sp. GW3-4 TaxID=3126740 RepID=UPI0030D621CC